MASQAPKVLIFGATGVIGRFITAALVDSKPSLGRLGIFTSANTVETKPAQIKSLQDQGVDVIVGDVRSESDVRDAYAGFDTVVSAVGRNVIADQIELIRIAEATPNIRRFFPSEYGTDIEFGPQSAGEKPHQQKLKVRGFIREQVKRLEYTYLVTGPYSDLYIGRSNGNIEAGGFDVQRKKAVLLGTGNEKIALTTMSDVGKLLVAAIQHPDASRNRALIVNSFVTTPKEILAEYERQTDSKWEVSYTPLEDLKTREEQLWSAGNPIATLYTLRRIWTEGGTLYNRPRDNALIGDPDTESLEHAVGEAIKKNA